jgi:hypothetical protein
MVNIRAINTSGFIDYVIKENKKLDYWCKDEFYQTFLMQHLRTENSQDALERSIKTMQKWAEDKDSSFNHYFLYGNSNTIVHDITTGRISSWVLYNCTSGVQFLDKINSEQIEMIFPYIEVDYWKKRFVDYLADTEFVKHILEQAGL